jgi:hypothetical protein
MSNNPRYDEDSPDYVSPWGWWFNGDRGKGVAWPDPRQGQISASVAPGTYCRPPASKGMTIHDMHDAVQELERLHPDRAGIGFHASEIKDITGRRSLQSVDPLLKAAIERGVLRMQMVRNVVPFGMSATNKAMHMYSTPDCPASRT